MKKWRYTKLGNWFWRNYWYRVDWWLGERRFYKWVKYGKDHGNFLKFDSWEQLHKWEDQMISDYGNPKRARITNIFRSYTKWD